MGGDGLLGAVAGELRGTDGVLGVLPGGRGNDFARKLGIGPDPERACDVLAAGRERASTSPTPAGGRTSGSRRPASTPTCRTSPTRRSVPLGELVYVYATLRALRGWRHARWQVVVDGAARSRSTATRSRWPTPACSAAACTSCPDASLDDGLLDVVLTRAASKRSYLAGLPKVFKGTHVDRPEPHVPARARDRVPRRPPVRRLRRRRPDRGPARHHQGRAARAEGARPVTLLGPKVAAAKAVGTLVRAAGRGGGTSLPGKVLTRLEPHAIGLLARRLRARQRGDQRDQRQDDDRGDDRRRSSSGPARRSSTTARARTWPAASRRALAAASRRGGRELTGELGLFEVDEFWLGAGRRGARAARAAARQPVPRPARPLRRARDHRRALGRGRGARTPARTALVLNADDPLVADLGRGARAALLRRRRRLARVRRAPARRRLQALPPLRAPLRVRGDLPRPPRPLRVPELRRAPARAGRRGARRRAARDPLGRVHAGDAGGDGARRAAAAGALQRLQRARRRGALPARSARRWTRSSRGCRRSRRRSGAPRRSTSAAARRRSCWSRTPRARTRCCARSRSRASGSTCSGC